MKKRRYCRECGEDITTRPHHHYLCYQCWKGQTFGINEIQQVKLYVESDDFSPKISKSNPTYIERYQGDSDYDMGPNWDYDEFPPENL